MVARSRYIDTLRAVAVARVYLHHGLWIGWLTVVFPSMWVMFALAGSLTAASLDRGGPARTIWSRVRRLLPPLWALAAVAIPLMLINGWRHDPVSPMRWSDLGWWVVPLANPPASSWGGPFALALWYLRAYLWFVLLSPVLWWAFKRWPLPTLAAPLLAAVAFHSGLVTLPANRVTDVLTATALYGTCWIAGFARHSGLLDRWPVKAYLAIGAAFGALGLAWGFARMAKDPAVTWVLGAPFAEMLWGTGFVLILMRLHPSMEWLDRFPRLSRAISTINGRAVTIYIWHLPVLWAAGALLIKIGLDPGGPRGLVTTTAVGVGLLTVVVLSLGWIEDIAARRRPAAVPSPLGAARPAAPARSPEPSLR